MTFEAPAPTARYDQMFSLFQDDQARTPKYHHQQLGTAPPFCPSWSSLSPLFLLALYPSCPLITPHPTLWAPMHSITGGWPFASR